jgi:hypothetical protein
LLIQEGQRLIEDDVRPASLQTLTRQLPATPQLIK